MFRAAQVERTCVVCGSENCSNISPSEDYGQSEKLRKFFQRISHYDPAMNDDNFNSFEDLLCSSCVSKFESLLDIYVELDFLNKKANELVSSVHYAFQTANPDYSCNMLPGKPPTKRPEKLKYIVATCLCVNKVYNSDPNHHEPASHPTNHFFKSEESSYSPPPASPISADEDAELKFKALPKCEDVTVKLERLSPTKFEQYMKKLQEIQPEVRPERKPDRPKSLKTKKKVQVPKDEKPARVQCPYPGCKRKTAIASEEQLKWHTLRAHEGVMNPYECGECGRRFRQKKIMEIHARTHTGVFPAVCDVCNMGFINQWALRQHYVKHTSELPYKCELCPKAYKGHKGLDYHMKKVHLESRSYICETCGKTFVASDKLKRHKESVHATGKPIMCHICGKSFAIRNYLYMHMRVHSGTQFFKKRKAPLRKEEAAHESSMNTNLDFLDFLGISGECTENPVALPGCEPNTATTAECAANPITPLQCAKTLVTLAETTVTPVQCAKSLITLAANTATTLQCAKSLVTLAENTGAPIQCGNNPETPAECRENPVASGDSLGDNQVSGGETTTSLAISAACEPASM